MERKRRFTPEEKQRNQMAFQPHRRGLPAHFRLSEKATTPFGMLNLLGFLTDRQYEAGSRFRVAFGEYLASIAGPDAGNGQGRGYPCRGDLNCDPCECANRKRAFREACRALDDVGHKAGVAVAHVAVHGKQCPAGFYGWLKRGLNALIEHYGLERRRAA